ncbi:MAG: hypothetical protein E7568_05955 [Ruminococcaceae bacterium]|nr:hypothetical protein [Oscillospiraceae bacterium]
MKLKNLLLTGLSFVLVAALAVGGTVAYLTSEDSDVNVMTLGNVKIEQHEYQRALNADGTYATDTIDDRTSYVLEAFEQGKALLPIVGDPSTGAAGWDTTTVRMSQVDSYGGMQVFAGKNAVDKFVTVENTGKTDAYVRTLVAIECGSGDENLIGSSYHSNWSKNAVGKVEIDENTYYVYEYIYKGASDGSRHVGGVLPAGDTSYPNLSQVYIKSVATNDDMDKLDGNGNGTLDILVLSQAVQADGFANAETALDTAFGDITTTNHPWVGGANVPVTVSSADELEDAFENGGTVILTDDITVPATLRVEPGVAVNLFLNGRTITVPDNSTSSAFNALFYSENGSDISISGNGIVDLGENGMSLVVTRGNVTIENGTFTRKVTDPNSAYPLISDSKHADGKGTTVINGGYFDAGYYDVNAKTFGETTADEATRGMPGDKNRYRVAIKDNITGTLNLSKSTFKVYGGTFVGANPAWGDEGCAMPITPNYERPWSYYQGTFLDGQQVYDDRIEIPAGYTITEGTTTDGRPTYTVNYSK